MSVSVNRLVSSRLRVEALGDTDLAYLLDAVAGPNRAARWVAAATADGGCRAVWPPDGSNTRDTVPPVAFLQRRGQPGVALSQAAADSFARRFPAAQDPATILRVAGFVAPVLAELEADVTGVGYRLEPSPKAQRILGIVGRFFPKGKAVALRVRRAEAPFGLYVQFDGARHVERIVGAQGWPEAVRAGEDLAALKTLGAAVEVGIDLTQAGFVELLRGGHNRAAFARMVAASDLRFAPCPLALRVALKAARIQ